MGFLSTMSGGWLQHFFESGPRSMEVVVPGPALPWCSIDVLHSSQDAVHFIIEWDTRRLLIDTEDKLFIYPFSQCSLRHLSYERNPACLRHLTRRALLKIQGITTEMSYTIDLRTDSFHEESILARLGAELSCGQLFPQASRRGGAAPRGEHSTGPAKGTSDVSSPGFLSSPASRTSHGEDQDGLVWTLRDARDQPVVWLDVSGPLRRVSDGEQLRKTPDPALNGADWPYVDLAEQRGRVPFPQAAETGSVPDLSLPLAAWTTSCMDLFHDVVSFTMPSGSSEQQRPEADVSKAVYGARVRWSDEPIMPVALVLIRHGDSGREDAQPLSRSGKIQSVRTSELLHYMMGGFSHEAILRVWSADCTAARETADIVWAAVEKLATSAVDCKRHIYSHLDASSQESLSWLLSGVLHAALDPSDSDSFGTLMTFSPTTYHPLTDNISDSQLRFLRCPLLTRPSARFPGLFRGCLSGGEEDTGLPGLRCVFSTHDTAIQYFLSKEFGLFPNDWKGISIPYGAAIMTGLHFSGHPCIVLGDAGYLSTARDKNAAHFLPMTFTPFLATTEKSQTPSTPRDRFMMDPVVTLVRHAYGSDHRGSPENLPEEKATARTSADNSSSASRDGGEPTPDAASYEKHILLMRPGHNVQRGATDAGLTELGRQQMERAAQWLGELLTSTSVIPMPTAWCVAGITSECSPIDTSLRDSISAVTEKLTPFLQDRYHDASLVSSNESMYPENLFSPASSPGELYVVLGDDYHLVKYFSVCFGMDPLKLRYALWPHAGFLLVKISETAVPELPLFGTVSHCHVSQLSF